MLPAHSPGHYFIACLTERYADFSGRSRRAEYWWFGLLSGLVLLGCFALGCLGIALDSAAVTLSFFGLGALFYLASIIPSLAVTARRLHDVGRSAAWMLLAFVPFGALVPFAMTLVPGQPHGNAYGPDPKADHGLLGEPDDPLDHFELLD